jgi:hypothetical protein
MGRICISAWVRIRRATVRIMAQPQAVSPLRPDAIKRPWKEAVINYSRYYPGKTGSVRPKFKRSTSRIQVWIATFVDRHAR